MASAILDQVVAWGLPYLIGRVYLADVDALEDLAQAIAIGGLYATFLSACSRSGSARCSAVWVYGIGELARHSLRWLSSQGLPVDRPRARHVDDERVLDLTCSGPPGRSRRSGASPFGMLMLALVGDDGALQIDRGDRPDGLWLDHFLGGQADQAALAIWLLIAISPIYCVTRTYAALVGPGDRGLLEGHGRRGTGRLLSYRLNMERLLADRALERPIFGWGRFNRFQLLTRRGDADRPGRVLDHRRWGPRGWSACRACSRCSSCRWS